ncbi:MAG: hypothetical protein GY810_03730 [Aureispira sp.]|nr:hypothetical protein [Aureispira sp.]
MTKSEKRSFKLQVAKYKNNSLSIELFDLLNQQSSYDEAKLLKKLKATTLVKKNFKVHKKHLYDAIMKSLRSSKVGTDTEIKLRQEFDYCVILRDKGFIDEAIQSLDKLIGKAKKNDSYAIWAEAALWKSGLVFNKMDKKSIEESLEALNEQLLAVDALRIQGDLNQFFIKGIHAMKKHGKDSVPQEIFQALLDYPEPSLPILKYKLYMVKIQYFFAQNQLEESYQISKKSIKLVHDIAAFQETNKIAYCSVMATHLKILRGTHRYQEMLELIELWSAFLKKEGLGLLATRSIFVLKRAVRYLELLGVLPQDFVLEHTVEDISQYINSELQGEVYTEWYDQIKYNFVKEDYKALLSINDLKDSFPLEVQVLNYTTTARLLIIIAYFELDQTNILSHFIDTTKYFLKQNELYEGGTPIILNFFNTKELYELKVPQAIFEKLQKELLEIGYKEDVILSWLDHKLTGKSILSCYRTTVLENKNKRPNSI